MIRNRRLRFVLLVSSLLVTVGAGASAGYEISDTMNAEQLIVRNLIGEIQVVGTNGSEFTVDVSVQGRDATRERVQVEFDKKGNPEVRVVFPLKESRQYVYPELSGKTRFSIRNEESGWLSHLLGSFRKQDIEVRPDGRGLEIWADVRIGVPRGKSLVLRHGAGNIFARNIRGHIDLDSYSGRIEASQIDGSVRADTGSGQVVLTGIEGDEVVVDTGSGKVEIDSIDTRRLHVDTGSGRVIARSVFAEDVLIDTGSGKVLLELDHIGSGKYDVDTGSGGIDLVLPHGASADIEADTGSGRIRIDVAGVHRSQRDSSDEAHFRIGDGAARIRLDTGSGSIHISERP